MDVCFTLDTHSLLAMWGSLSPHDSLFFLSPSLAVFFIWNFVYVHLILMKYLYWERGESSSIIHVVFSKELGHLWKVGVLFVFLWVWFLPPTLLQILSNSMRIKGKIVYHHAFLCRAIIWCRTRDTFLLKPFVRQCKWHQKALNWVEGVQSDIRKI